MGAVRAFFTLLLVVTGCSSRANEARSQTTRMDGSGGKGTSAHDGGKDAEGVSSAAGGPSGGRSSSGGAAPVRVDAGPPFKCSHETCKPLPMKDTAVFASCCLEDGMCGWSMKLMVPFLQGLFGLCEPFEQPGAPTAECQDVVVTFSQAFQELARYKGCCRPDGHCGAVLHDSSGCVAGKDINGSMSTCTP